VRYNPDVPPDPAKWLALDEGEQIALVEEYHRGTHVESGQPTLHAAIHAVVERQLAMELGAVVRALARLRAEGLDRHDAVHAIGAILGEHMRQLMTGELDAKDSDAVYFGALDQLSAESWRREFGLDDHAV
jgi:hypothetical protein